MRFMMLMYPARKSEEGVLPTLEEMTTMREFNKEMCDAGILLSLDGLHPTSKGTRVTFAGGKAKITDGPFTETKEVLGGYWMIEVNSKEEAVAWAARCPIDDPEVMIEVRKVFEITDFPQDIQDAAKEWVEDEKG